MAHIIALYSRTRPSIVSIPLWVKPLISLINSTFSSTKASRKPERGYAPTPRRKSRKNSFQIIQSCRQRFLHILCDNVPKEILNSMFHQCKPMSRVHRVLQSLAILCTKTSICLESSPEFFCQREIPLNSFARECNLSQNTGKPTIDFGYRAPRRKTTGWSVGRI